jgi:hypothetical protein
VTDLYSTFRLQVSLRTGISAPFGEYTMRSWSGNRTCGTVAVSALLHISQWMTTVSVPRKVCSEFELLSCSKNESIFEHHVVPLVIDNLDRARAPFLLGTLSSGSLFGWFTFIDFRLRDCHRSLLPAFKSAVYLF